MDLEVYQQLSASACDALVYYITDAKAAHVPLSGVQANDGAALLKKLRSAGGSTRQQVLNRNGAIGAENLHTMHGWPLFRDRMLNLFRLRRNDIRDLADSEKLTPKEKLDMLAPKVMTVFPNPYDAWVINGSKPNPTNDFDILITQCNSLYYARAEPSSQKMATMVAAQDLHGSQDSRHSPCPSPHRGEGYYDFHGNFFSSSGTSLPPTTAKAKVSAKVSAKAKAKAAVRA